MFWFPLDIEGVGGFHLHPIGEFKGLYPGLQGAFVLPPFRVPTVHLLDEIQLAALRFGRDGPVADIGNQLIDLGELRIDVRSLVTSRQEGRLPVLGVLDRVAARTKDDERGKVLVLGSQTVREPRADARAGQTGLAAVHQHQRRLVIGNVRVHRADDAEIVGMFAEVGKQLADFHAALAVLLEFERRGKGRSRLAFGAQVFVRQGFSRKPCQGGLGVEGVDMRRPAIQEDMNDVLGLGGKMRRLGGQRILELRRGGLRFTKQGSESQHAHPQAGLDQHFATRAERTVGLRGKRVQHAINHDVVPEVVSPIA